MQKNTCEYKTVANLLFLHGKAILNYYISGRTARQYLKERPVEQSGASRKFGLSPRLVFVACTGKSYGTVSLDSVFGESKGIARIYRKYRLLQFPFHFR